VASSWFNVTTNQPADGFPNAEADIAIIDGTHTSGSGNLVVGAAFTVGEIQFSDDTDLIIALNPGGELTLDKPGSAGGKITHSGSGDLTLRPQINTVDGVQFDVTSTGELNQSGALTGAVGFGGYTKTGSGTMNLTGNNSNTFGVGAGGQPGFTISAGTLRLQKTGGAIALSAGSSIGSDGILLVGTGSGDEQIGNGVPIGVNGTFTLNNPIESMGRINTGTGLIQLNGNTLKLGANGGGTPSNFAGVIGNSGTIDLTGDGSTPAGLFTLNGLSSATATINFIRGTVDVMGDGSNYTFVLDGTGLSGTGTLGSVIQKLGGVTATVSPGSNGVATSSFGTLNVQGTISGNVNDALHIRFHVAGPTPGVDADQFVVSGNGAMGAVVNPEFDITTANFANSLPGTTITIVDVQNVTTPAPFNGLPEGATVESLGNGFVLAISYVGGDGNDVVLRVVPDLTNVTTLAPTFVAANGRSATFLDTDGDLITVTINKGTLTAANFLYRGINGGTGGTIESIDLTAGANPAAFKGATLTVKAAKAVGGDGFVNIGRVNATGIDLAKVTIPGDLGQVDAGDAVAKTAGLGTLSVHSLGSLALVTQRSPFASTQDFLTSSIVGKLGTLSATVGKSGNPAIAGVNGAFLDVTGGANSADARFGGIGRITTDAVVGALVPTVFAPDGTVTFASGTIRASGPIGPVFIEYGIAGSVGDYSGDLWSRTSISSVKVGGKLGPGNVAGGAGFDSGAIFAGSPDNNGPEAGRVSGVTLKGSLIGGAGINSGTIYADGGIGNVSIGGSVVGGPNVSSGAIVSGLGISSVRITGNLTGGPAPVSGSIVALGGNVSSISVAGSMQNVANTPFTGVFVDGTIGKLIAGKLENAGGAPGVISALGKVNAKTGALLPGNAITSVTVKGDVTGWAITAGFDNLFDITNTNVNALKHANASIGTVTVAGNFTNSFITAGTLWGGANPAPGTGDEIHMPGDLLPTVLATIAKVTIAGQTTNAVIEAERIAAVTVNKVKAALTAGVDFPPVGNIAGAIIVEIV